MTPDFPVGRIMTNTLMTMLLEDPDINDIELASVVGADVDHPFFQTDLSLAKAMMAGGAVSQGHLKTLERQQMINVQIATAMCTADLMKPLDITTLRNVLPVIDAILASHWPIQQVRSGAQLLRLRRSIESFAGDTSDPSELVIQRYLWEHPGFLRDADEKVKDDLLKKVLSAEGKKDDVARAAEGPTTSFDADTEGRSDGEKRSERETDRTAPRDGRS